MCECYLRKGGHLRFKHIVWSLSEDNVFNSFCKTHCVLYIVQHSAGSKCIIVAWTLETINYYNDLLFTGFELWFSLGLTYHCEPTQVFRILGRKYIIRIYFYNKNYNFSKYKTTKSSQINIRNLCRTV